ncbi:hypothetical protein ACFRCG_09795 [Embleya sp. NPDC056575]|uniref:hypothetical protein n=1 Tax=unclassified Embleya TaxID=2699296 RepID=UPI0036B2E301
MTVTDSSLRPLLAVAVCHLCDRRTPAAGATAVTPRTAAGSPRPVRLCAHCRDNRPGRAGGELVADDRTWVFVERESTSLISAYEAGRWLPYHDELHWAQALNTATWTQGLVARALCDAREHVRAGRLIRVVEHLPRLLALVDDGDRCLASLRRLLDVLTQGPA